MSLNWVITGLYKGSSAASDYLTQLWLFIRHIQRNTHQWKITKLTSFHYRNCNKMCHLFVIVPFCPGEMSQLLDPYLVINSPADVLAVLGQTADTVLTIKTSVFVMFLWDKSEATLFLSKLSVQYNQCSRDNFFNVVELNDLGMKQTHRSKKLHERDNWINRFNLGCRVCSMRRTISIIYHYIYIYIYIYIFIRT